MIPTPPVSMRRIAACTTTHVLRFRDDTELCDRHKARSQARKLKPEGEPLVAALFGAARAQEAR